MPYAIKEVTMDNTKNQLNPEFWSTETKQTNAVEWKSFLYFWNYLGQELIDQDLIEVYLKKLETIKVLDY